MIPEDLEELWQRILAYQIDDPKAEKPFSDRLAEEQGWSKEFALRAIDEYKKFIFMCVTLGREVSPSLTVDEVWHLHLLYTKSYLEDFCLTALNTFVHHRPSTGGNAEKNKFRNVYVETLHSYRGFFGEPPLDIWGPENGKNVRKYPVTDISNMGIAMCGPKIHPANRSAPTLKGLVALLRAAIGKQPK